MPHTIHYNGVPTRAVDAVLGENFHFSLIIEGLNAAGNPEAVVDDAYEVHFPAGEITFDNNESRVAVVEPAPDHKAELMYESPGGFTTAGTHTIEIRKAGEAAVLATLEVTVTDHVAAPPPVVPPVVPQVAQPVVNPFVPPVVHPFVPPVAPPFVQPVIAPFVQPVIAPFVQPVAALPPVVPPAPAAPAQNWLVRVMESAGNALGGAVVGILYMTGIFALVFAFALPFISIWWIAWNMSSEVKPRAAAVIHINSGSGQVTTNQGKSDGGDKP